MRKKLLMSAMAWLAISTIHYQLSTAFAQGTAFTYQGRLNDGGNPANGTYDIRAGLYIVSTGGTVFAGPITNVAVTVSNGLFTIPLDYGAVFDGTVYWLQVAVRTNGGSAFTVLGPRQQLTPTPYAIFSEGANAAGLSGTVPSASLVGAYGSIVNFTNPANTFTGNGSGLTGVNAATLGGLASSNFWITTGNAKTSPTNGNFMGTTDNNPLEIRVNGSRALRLEPIPNASNISNMVNVVGGSPINSVAAGTVGATIAGGGSSLYIVTGALGNSVSGDLGTIGGGGANIVSGGGGTVAGGRGNYAGIFAFPTVSGGESNSASGPSATVGGGFHNLASGGLSGFTTVAGGSGNAASGGYAAVGGGSANVSGGDYSAVGGGSQNQASGQGAFIGGGASNTNSGINATISGGSGNAANSTAAAVGGGSANSAAGAYSTVAGGFGNSASYSAAVGGGSENDASGNYSTLAGGFANAAGGYYSAVAGGNANSAGGYASFAAGQYAQTTHDNTFIWGDGSQDPFTGANADNAFNVLASGGVFLYNGTNGVHVDGLGNNDGTIDFALKFGGALSSGEGIASKRTAGGNQYGLDFYTTSVNRMTIGKDGRVGIGTTTPSAKLDVNGEFLVVEGLGRVQCYIGDDGVANDVQVGSLQSGVTSVSFYNATDNAYMHIGCSSITIHGGSDLAEPFQISSSAGDIPQGAVVVIDEKNPGRLKLSDLPYDTRVAGVVSGANGVNPGIQMQQQGLLEGGKNVALSGRVYVQADTSSGAIRPGDLLTSSTTPGYAMKAANPRRAQGAILGKAMTPLDHGQGMVLVLVSLQ